MIISRTVTDELFIYENIIVSDRLTVPYYGSLVKANQYFASMLEGKKWNSYSVDDRQLALKSATQKLDRLNYVGMKTDINQQFQFPRSGDTLVPLEIQQANYEIAYSLLRGIEPETERDNTFKSSRAYGNVRSTNDMPESVQPWFTAGIPSSIAWDLILPYLNPRTVLRLLKV